MNLPIRISILTAVACWCLLGLACAPKKDLTTLSSDDIPKWYTHPPADADHLYGEYTAASQDMQLSVDKASTGATNEIAKQIEIKVQGLQKKFEEEVGSGDSSQLLQQFTQATRTVVSQTLSGVRVREQKSIQGSNGVWRTYLLAEYSVADANKAILESVKAKEQLLTRVRSTKTFQELDDEVGKYQSSK